MAEIQKINTSTKPFFKKSNFWQKILLFFIAFAIWQIFYPGLMSPDSMAQYEQALGGYFNDWHPPLPSIVLWFIMKLGGGIGTLIFIQCVAAIFGLRTTLSLMLEFFSSQQLSKSNCKKTSTILTVIFLIPLFTPFMFFSVIFWKDAWVAIILLWIASYLLWIFLNIEIITKNKFIIHLSALSLSTAFMPLVRHNALAVLPIICLCLTILSVIKFGRIGLAAFVLPVLLTLVISPLIYDIFKVREIHIGNTVLASDLATMVRLYPELQSEFPIAARHQNSPILLAYDVGLTWDGSTEGKPCPYFDCQSPLLQECYGTPKNTSDIDGRNCYLPVGEDNPALKAEYFKAITHEPVKFTAAKLHIFWQMLHPRNWDTVKFVGDIFENKYGLVINNNFTNVREKLIKLSTETGQKLYFNWISGMHIVWLVLNILFVIYSLINVSLKRDRKSLFVLSLFLIPLSYYFSYFLATTTSDYRFMYPSTLIMQTLTVSIIISWILTRLQPETEPEPQINLED